MYVVLKNVQRLGLITSNSALVAALVTWVMLHILSYVLLSRLREQKEIPGVRDAA
jgi:hypothetical protein